ncbi:putative ubiquitin interacting, EF-hand domain pair [Lupinus albus]|uniref:Putative ubiquitin interacting, EF-hand domain pair n=1 Tax=Lupinus albus TaxID=3870 RepID=A0A6A4PNK5_LUPAL|nr:putative ubiquitin interacting, EF-hand domain pair [Lupinus albus]
MQRNRRNSNHSTATPNSDESETAAKGKPRHSGVSEYEKQRLSRIAENKARLEALGLSRLSSSFNNKGKKKVQDEDDEYKPENEEPGSSSSSDEDHYEKDEDFEAGNSSGSRKRKVKNKCLKMKAKISRKKCCSSNMEYIDDEDEALRQAIALSLQGSAEDPYFSDKNVVNITGAEKGNIHVEEDKGRKKSKKSFTSRLKMTEDELIVHFFQLDEAGKGTVSVRDLQRAAKVHDFIWTDKELVDMIRFFDSDGDGKLSFDDFKKIVVRCNMIEGSSNS